MGPAGGNGVEGVEARGARAAVVAPEGVERPVLVNEVVVGQRVGPVRERGGGEAVGGDRGDLRRRAGQVTRAAELLALPGGELERVGRHGIPVARGRRRWLGRSRSGGGEGGNVGSDGGGDVVVHGGREITDIGVGRRRGLVTVVGFVRLWLVGLGLVRLWLVGLGFVGLGLVGLWLIGWRRRSHLGNVLVVRRLESVLDLRRPRVLVLGLLVVGPR